mgnify:FL=1
MNKFSVQLDTIKDDTGKKSFSFDINDSFFEAYAFSDIEHVDITAYAELKNDGENILLNLMIDGKINKLLCDICAEELSISITGETNIIIKKTNEKLVSTDEIVYLKRNENKLNLQHLIFELIVVNTPTKRQHALDKEGNRTCNKKMINLLNQYTTVKEKSPDPRWNILKNLT